MITFEWGINLHSGIKRLSAVKKSAWTDSGEQRERGGNSKHRSFLQTICKNYIPYVIKLAIYICKIWGWTPVYSMCIISHMITATHTDVINTTVYLSVLNTFKCS